MSKKAIHIGIIMDGNRRYAKRLNLLPWKGHEHGAKKVEEVIGWCKDFNVHELTLYTFSMQNFNRTKEEFGQLMRLFKEGLEKLKKSQLIKENKIRINFIGRIEKFPKDVQDKIKSAMELTKNNNNHVVNFAMAYGGREEITDAVRKISSEVKNGKLKIGDIDENLVGNHLYMKDEPDLIIRTGGEKRTSNFLIWQSNYSEWFFVEKTWPEFSKQDFKAIIDEFLSRERRFGK